MEHYESLFHLEITGLSTTLACLPSTVPIASIPKEGAVIFLVLLRQTDRHQWSNLLPLLETVWERAWKVKKEDITRGKEGIDCVIQLFKKVGAERFAELCKDDRDVAFDWIKCIRKALKERYNMEVAKAKSNPPTTGGTKALTTNAKVPVIEIVPKSISSSSLSSSNSPPIASTSTNSNSWAPPPRPGQVVFQNPLGGFSIDTSDPPKEPAFKKAPLPSFIANSYPNYDFEEGNFLSHSTSNSNSFTPPPIAHYDPMCPFPIPYTSNRSILFGGVDSGSSRSNSPSFSTGASTSNLPISPRESFDNLDNDLGITKKLKGRPRSESIDTSEDGSKPKPKLKGRPRGSTKKKDTLFQPSTSRTSTLTKTNTVATGRSGRTNKKPKRFDDEYGSNEEESLNGNANSSIGVIVEMETSEIDLSKRIPFGTAVMAKLPAFSWWPGIILDPSTTNPPKTFGKRAPDSYLVKSIPDGYDWSYLSPSLLVPLTSQQTELWISTPDSIPDEYRTKASKTWRVDWLEALLIAGDSERLKVWSEKETDRELSEREKQEEKEERKRSERETYRADIEVDEIEEKEEEEMDLYAEDRKEIVQDKIVIVSS